MEVIRRTFSVSSFVDTFRSGVACSVDTELWRVGILSEIWIFHQPSDTVSFLKRRRACESMENNDSMSSCLRREQHPITPPTTQTPSALQV